MARNIVIKGYQDTKVTLNTMVYNLQHNDMFIVICNLSIKS